MSANENPAPLPFVRTAWRVVGAIGSVLVVFLAVGFLLSGRWSVERSATTTAAPQEVFDHLDDLGAWDAWTPWPPDTRHEGPRRGVGARRAWDDPNVGAGSIEIVAAQPGRRIGYRVEVSGGLQFEGEILLERSEGRTLVRWRESGDFGWNPLLGYTALFMDRLQGPELEKSLERLVSAVEG